MARIVVTEAMVPESLERLREVATVEYDPELWKDPTRLKEAVQDAEAVVVRNQTPVTAELLASARLKVIGRVGVGLDNIDLEAARARQVTVVAAWGANAIAVAEYVLAYCFHAARKLSEVSQLTRQGQWDRTLGGYELYEKTLGLVGLGDIGQRLALRARALGMAVVAHDPWRLPTHWSVMELGIELCPLSTVLERADFVSIHVPLTASTRHIIGEAELRRMKRGAHLVNTARGGVVDEAALLRAVQAEWIAGACLDVRELEPPVQDDPLAREPRIMLTPHIAGLTAEARQRTANLVVDDVARVLRGEAPRAAVGLEVRT
jgi:D-3-phosphoglycerate dehydrogenase